MITFRESWLSNQSIPYERIEAIRGESTGCVVRKTNPMRCAGISGVRETNLHIMKHKNTSGLTLVLEDDVYVQTDRLMYWVRQVPNDWDIIRFDCSAGRLQSNFSFITNW